MSYAPSEHEVETYSGRFVDVNHPDPATVALEDIAHALSQTCRYGGHCQRFYSVAEHAVFVSHRLERKGYSLQVVLAGLHHDDAEAYLGDIPRPMKPLLGTAYDDLTQTMDTAIAVALGLPDFDASVHAAVKDADNWSLFVEARHLLPSRGKGWWDGEQGAWRWNIGTMPSRIVTPDYFAGGVKPQESELLYLKRHSSLVERITL